jgi:acyl dehydratase
VTTGAVAESPGHGTQEIRRNRGGTLHGCAQPVNVGGGLTAGPVASTDRRHSDRRQDPVPQLFWEDFRPGPLAECGPYLVTADEIRAFAAEFDPQEMHVAAGGSDTGMLDGLFASGWHNCAIMTRLVADGFLCDSAFMGGAGCDEVKWLHPVRANDELTVRPQVLETRESRTRGHAGFVKFLFEVVNGHGVTVMAVVAHLMFRRRTPR